MTRLGDILRSLADKADGAEGRLDALEAKAGSTPKAYIGTIIRPASGTHILLITGADFEEAMGTVYSVDKHAVFAWNGDYNANTAVVIGTSYTPSTGNFGVDLSDATYTPIRLNYMIVEV